MQNDSTKRQTKLHRYWHVGLLAGVLCLASAVTTALGQGCGGNAQSSSTTTGNTSSSADGSTGDSTSNTPPDGEVPTGDPVVVPSGGYMEKHSDLKAQQGISQFAVARFYTSTSDVTDSGMGLGWDTTLSMRIVDHDTDGVTVYLGGTDPINFAKSGGSYLPADRTRFTVSGSNGNFELTYDNGDHAYFDSNNHVTKYQFKSGQDHEWVYSGTNVVTVKNSGTPIIAVDWDSSPARITKVKTLKSDGMGGYTEDRAVAYTYDASSRLSKVDGTCGSCGDSGSGRIYTYVASGNGAGKIETVSDLSDSRQLKMVYDSAGRVVTQYKHTDATPYANWTYQEYAQGVYEYTDFEGFKQRLYFDNNYKQTREEWLKNTTVLSVWEKMYDMAGNGRITRESYATSISGGTTKWQETSYAYDANHNTTLEVHYDYSAANPITVHRQTYGSFANVTMDIDANGVTKTFDYDDAGTGRLTKTIANPGGLALTTSYAYDANGLETQRTDPDGAVTSYAYDDNGHLTKQILDPTGLAITTTYYPDAAGRVTKRTDPNGHDWQTYYTATNKVTQRIDPAPGGLTTTYDYDVTGRLLTQQQYSATSGTTRVQVLVYDDLGRMVTQRQRLTATPTYADTIYAYDANDKQTYMRRPDGVTTGRIVQIYHEGGEQEPYELAYDGANWFTRATYLRDMTGRVTRQQDANGSDLVKARIYDGYGRLSRQVDALDHYTAYFYDALGQLTRTVNYDSGDTAQAESRMAYDAAGRALTARQLASPAPGSPGDADKLVVMAYDANGQLLTQTTSLTAGDSAVAISTYDAAGRLLTRTASDAPTVAYSYDAAGNVLTQKTDPTGLAITIIQQYDSVGRVTHTTQPDSTYQVSLYDAFGQVTKAIAYDTSGGRLAVTGQFYDDHLGVVTRSYQISSPSTTDTFNSTNDPYSDALYTAGGRLTKTIDPLSHATTYDYDGLGRRITTTDPIGNKVVPLYDNADRLLTQVRLDYDGANYSTFKTAYEYDFRGRVTKTIDQGPDGDITATTDNLASTQWYDALGQVTQAQDPAGQQTAFLFDKLGQLTRTTEDASGGGVARYTDRAYDRGGRLTRLTGYPVDSSNPQNTDYAYNKIGVQTRVTWPDDSPGSSRGYVVYSYDAALRLTRINHQDDTNTDVVYDSMGRKLTLTKGSEIDSFAYAATGQLTHAARSLVAPVIRAYDGLGRLTRETQLGAENVDYAYDKAGNVLTLTYPNVRYDSPGSMAVQTTYDALGRALTVKRDGSVLASYHYVGDRPKSQTFETGANDVTLNMTYDGVARLTRMAYSQTGNTSLPDFTYNFDSASDITRKTFNDKSGTPSEDYQYDTLHRLTRTTFGQRTSTPYKGYIYDDLGNHLTQDDNGTTTVGLFNAVNEQTKRGAPGSEVAVLYDARGNLTKDDSGKAYYYDRQNMLTRVDDSSGNMLTTYAYDAFNRLVSKEAVGWPAGVSFVYDGWRRLEEHPGGEPIAEYCYVWTPGSAGYIDDLLCYIRAPGSANLTYYPCRNHNFSVTAMLNSSGGVAERYDYNPYGERIVLDPDYANDADGISDIINPIGFQGLFHDDETGLIYVRNRYLNPTLGRWMTRDPTGYPDGMNAYAGYQLIYCNYDPFGLDDSSFSLGGYMNADGKTISIRCAICHGSPDGTLPNLTGFGNGQPNPAQYLVLTQLSQNATSGADLSYQWLLGNSTRERSFGPGSEMTETLRKHSHISAVRSELEAALTDRCDHSDESPLRIIRPYSLKGDAQTKVGQTLTAVKNFAGNLATNQSAAFLGSYYLVVVVDSIDCSKCVGMAHFVVTNPSSASSGTRIHYGQEPSFQEMFEEVGFPNVIHRALLSETPSSVLKDDPFGSSGPLHTINETIHWDETIHFEK